LNRGRASFSRAGDRLQGSKDNPLLRKWIVIANRP
jgi:hypothetical protein